MRRRSATGAALARYCAWCPVRTSRRSGRNPCAHWHVTHAPARYNPAACIARANCRVAALFSDHCVFGAVAARLVDVMVFGSAPLRSASTITSHARRADLVDRNGTLIARDLPVSDRLYAMPAGVLGSLPMRRISLLRSQVQTNNTSNSRIRTRERLHPCPARTFAR